MLSVAVPAAGATTDTTPCSGSAGHCYAVVQRVTSGIVAAQLWENRDDLWASVSVDPYAHFNSEMWITLADGTSVETGYRYGSDLGSAGAACNNVCYDVFWAETDTTGLEHRHIVSNITNTGSQDFFQVAQSGTKWAVKVNGVNQGSTAYLVPQLTAGISIGAELEQSTCSRALSTGFNTNMHAQIQAIGGTMHDADWTSSHVDCAAGTYSASSSANGLFSWSKP